VLLVFPELQDTLAMPLKEERNVIKLFCNVFDEAMLNHTSIKSFLDKHNSSE
jgi:hypothetical protein